ncbi:hypothetical protein ALT761_03575 [Alteromonas sp. 76-1]|jgi:hypothetical protein|uniref:hypothetical protein n=1 Tax=Alteromonas sp. 76-1 TaxID=2358187 RepID=UPI000FD1608A|nr:hypothetical protein [Alteromonas sp. 76-1]VEL98552.1 hypothetical protein ALT761_03575 [Alteromonas sp. 76-1]
MRTLFTLILLTIASPTWGALITFDFDELTLTNGSSQAFVSGSISFDDSASEYSAYAWESFGFNFEYDGDTFLLDEDHLTDIEIVDLDDLIFGDDDPEGFVFTFFNGDYVLATGQGGMGADETCFYTTTDNLCANGLFSLTRAPSQDGSVSVSEPPIHMFVPLLLMVLFIKTRK